MVQYKELKMICPKCKKEITTVGIITQNWQKGILSGGSLTDIIEE